MKRLLIADDEEILRMLIVDTFEDSGYAVDEAEDGRQALELWNCFSRRIMISLFLTI